MSDGSTPKEKLTGIALIVDQLQRDRLQVEVNMASAETDIASYETFIEHRKRQVDGYKGHLDAIDAAVRALQAH